jgi:cell cycle arrest protein BUB3
MCSLLSKWRKGWQRYCSSNKCNFFHPIYGTFSTEGCNGYANIGVGNNKKHLYQYSKYPTSIASLSFSRDGRLLAVASSYTFEEGDNLHEPDAIFVRSVDEAELKTKPKKMF